VEAHEVCPVCGDNEATVKVYSVKVCGPCLNRVQVLIAELARIIGPGFDTTPVPRVREIGEELNRIGGMSLMIDVSMKSSEINPRARGFLGRWWDGVGDWVD
jgi:hypothetical protein